MTKKQLELLNRLIIAHVHAAIQPSDEPSIRAVFANQVSVVYSRLLKTTAKKERKRKCK